ncbi:hypothetical protein TorRG33x02_055380 [Trema orientale]|uniref:Uncharacterized protein n=1 Tax=Trema orientale TaxID=63057 RepID=A0A2P5FLG5_TREOI|nr:hypothetical protein TorRG33x02_055380 [Trema orientale]
MDLDEVAKLCERVNLDDENGPVVEMPPTIYSESKDRLDLCLMGKVLGNKEANKDGLKGTLQNTWMILRIF